MEFLSRLPAGSRTAPCEVPILHTWRQAPRCRPKPSAMPVCLRRTSSFNRKVPLNRFVVCCFFGDYCFWFGVLNLACFRFREPTSISCQHQNNTGLSRSERQCSHFGVDRLTSAIDSQTHLHVSLVKAPSATMTLRTLHLRLELPSAPCMRGRQALNPRELHPRQHLLHLKSQNFQSLFVSFL